MYKLQQFGGTDEGGAVWVDVFDFIELEVAQKKYQEYVQYFGKDMRFRLIEEYTKVIEDSEK